MMLARRALPALLRAVRLRAAAVVIAIGLAGGPAVAQDPTAHMLPRELHPDTVIVARGQPRAAIVAPQEGEYAAAATRCQAIVEEATGVRLPIRAPAAVTDERGLLLNDDAKQMSLVFVGHVGVHPALLEPYLRRWLVADDASPPPGEFLVETRPNPWGAGHGYLLVGASDADGMGRAVEAFEQLVGEQGSRGELALPRVVLPGPDPLQSTAERWRRLARPKNEDWLKGFKQAGAMHLGYHVGRELHQFALITELGYLSPDEVNDIENEVLENILMIPEKVWWYAEGGGSVSGRHEMFKNPRLYLACEHLLGVGRPNEAARAKLRELMRGPREYMRYAVTTAYRSDHEGTEADHAWQSAIWFALLMRDWEYFESGLARQAAMYGLLETDNLGGLAGHIAYGGVANLAAASTVRNVIRSAAWWYRDGRFRWLLDNLPLNDQYSYGFPIRLTVQDVEPQEPTEWLGVRWLPISEHSYSSSRGSGDWLQPEVAREDTVDLLAFREGYGRDDQYLCIDGFQNHFHPLGLNSVLRYVDRGKLFLVAHTDKQGNYYKSGVVVSRGVRTQPQPWGVLRRAGANLPHVGLAATLFPQNNGCDWTRYVFWRRGQYFLFMDDVVARQPGRFNLTATWRAAAPAQLGADASQRSQRDVSSFIEPTTPARLTGDGWQQSQGDVTFFVKSAFPLDQRASRGRAEQYQNEVIPDLLRQTLRLAANEAGDRAAFHNLLYATGPGDEQSFSARRLTPTSCLVRGTRTVNGRTTEELALLGLGGEKSPEPVQTDAVMFYISPERVALANGSVLKLADQLLASSLEKQDLEADVPRPARDHVARTLGVLWERGSAKQPTAQRLPRRVQPRTRWAFDDFRGHPRAVEPTWVEASPDAGTWTYRFPEPVNLAAALVGENRSAPIKSAVVEFSNDDFAADVRVTTDLQRSSRIHGPYGKSFFATQRLLRCAGRRAQSVRVRVTEWANKAPPGAPHEIGFVEFYSAERDPAYITRLIASELDGDSDGRELLVQTRDNQLVVLDTDGRRRWGRQLEHNLMSLAALDVDGDGRREVVCCDAASDLHCFGGHGAPKQRGHLSTAESIYQDFFRSNRAYALGLWRPPGEPGPSLMMGTYQSAAWVKPDGSIVCWPEHSDEGPYRSGFIWRGLVYWDRTLPEGLDLNGDGVEDQAFLGRGWATQPSIIFFDGARLDALAEHSIPNGWPLGLEVIELPDGRRAIVGVNEFHLGLYSVPGAGELWRVRFDTPAADWALWRRPDAWRLAIAKRDGMVLLLDEAGKVTHRQLLRPELRALAPVKSARGTYLLAAGDAGVAVLDEELQVLGSWPQAVHLLASLDEATVVGATGDGRVVALSLP